MWKLVIEDDEGKRTVVPLSRDDYTIGRQEGNTIRLTERNVSRTHGRVRRNRSGNGAGHVFVLEDLRSYNGLFVNGLRVAHTQDLQHGDLIQIGDYRIVLQDDAAASVENATIPITTTDPSDAKATIPIAPAYRGQTLTERPNRLVMLVGPTPGVEYPLDRERMTVGRAEDASISVNHNSVSRLHCEVHALGDGRFEIVDKGSSNGVRVNAVELRRSIIEAGDVIELGDVRFKFVGAGQIFVPGPNESQQLTAISDREAELVSPKKGLGGYVVPVVGAGLVGAVIILAFVYVLRQRAGDPVEPGINAADTEQTILANAKAKCTVEECEEAHAMAATIPEGSAWRDHADFQYVTSTWAESLLNKARLDPDTASRRATLSRVLADPRVDAATKQRANDLLTLPEPAPTPTDLPTVAAKDSGAVATTAPVAPTPPPTRTTPTSHTTVTNATTSAPTAAPPPPKPSVSALEKAREAALRGEPAAVRQHLEQKVRNGHGTPEEANLVRQACKAMGDRACSEDVKAKYP
ncbi:MAG: FHA domain-containing protein [Labilithrix sp.]|nr:FHA domain-containing protein [Labilithrix sp.]MBX3220241.1 FHA domain-containing protein [Labilithrix sp.]